MSLWGETKDSRIKKRDGVYWARFMKRGKRVEVSLETRNFELAKTLIADIEGKLLAGRSWKRERQLFRDAWIEFLVDKKLGNRVRPARDKTLREYAGFGVRYYLPYFGEMRLSDIDSKAWELFVKETKRSHPDILFFNIRKYMMGFLTWAKRHEKILVPPYLFDPDAKLTKEKEEFTPGKAFTKDELSRLRKASAQRPTFHAFMLAMQYMGMRPGEVNQLKRDRLDFRSGVIKLKKVDTKTNSARNVPIHPLAIDALKAQYALTEGLEHMFPNRSDEHDPMDPQGFKKVWEACCEEAGVEGRVYDLRHTFITHAIAGGINPAIVARITGTSLRIIEKYYLHLTDNDLSSAIKGFEL